MKKGVMFFLGAVLCVMMLVSCNPIANCGKVYGAKEVYGKATLSFGIEGFNPTARTINPDVWGNDPTDARSNALSYKLTGTRTLGGTENEIDEDDTTFTFDHLSSGTATIHLDPAIWYLTLTAYQGENKALESPQCSVDLRSGHAEYTFPLLAVTGTDATGDIKVAASFILPANLDKVVYGLYESGAQNAAVVNGIKAGETEAAPLSYELARAAIPEAEILNADHTITLDATGVKAGTYFFNANFLDEAGNTIAYYTERAYIDGGNISQKEFTLPDIFEKPPVAPSNFAVQYIYNGAAPAVMQLEEGAAPTTYLARFTWEDNADNETGYELILTDEDGDEVDLTATEGTGKITAGNLLASSTGVTVTLATGVYYDATLRAINRYSPAAAADEDEGIVQTKDDINLYTVTYHLNYGSVKTGVASTAVTPNTVVTYVTPYTSDDTPALLAHEVPQAGYPYVFRNNFTFVAWRTDVADADTAVTAVTAGDNLEITAYWDAIQTLGMSRTNYSGSDDLIQNMANGSMMTFPGTAGAITLTAVDGISNIGFALYNNVSGNPIEDEAVIETTETTCELHFNTLDAGIYRVVVTATKTYLNDPDRDDDDVTRNVSNELFFKVTR